MAVSYIFKLNLFHPKYTNKLMPKTFATKEKIGQTAFGKALDKAPKNPKAPKDVSETLQPKVASLQKTPAKVPEKPDIHQKPKKTD